MARGGDAELEHGRGILSKRGPPALLGAQSPLGAKMSLSSDLALVRLPRTACPWGADRLISRGLIRGGRRRGAGRAGAGGSWYSCLIEYDLIAK